MIKLVHYRKQLCETDNNNILVFENRSLIIKLRKQNKVPNFERALFFTTRMFHDSLKAKESLSISYSPKCMMSFAFDPSTCTYQIYTNEGKRIRLPLTDTNIPLIWPAFGHLGGAPELIITERGANVNTGSPCDTPPPNDSNPSNAFNCTVIGHGKLSSPYIDDLHRQDDVSHYSTAFLQQVASNAISAILEEEFSFYGAGNEREEYQFIGNLRGSEGVSFHLGMNNWNTHYSLSIGKRCYLHGIELMVWGYAWQDWGNFRLYQGPISTSFFWPLCHKPHQSLECTKEERELLEKSFIEELCHYSYLREEVNDTLKLVMDKLKEVNDLALKTAHYVYKLPSISTVYWP